MIGFFKGEYERILICDKVMKLKRSIVQLCELISRLLELGSCRANLIMSCKLQEGRSGTGHNVRIGHDLSVWAVRGQAQE